MSTSFKKYLFMLVLSAVSFIRSADLTVTKPINDNAPPLALVPTLPPNSNDCTHPITTDAKQVHCDPSKLDDTDLKEKHASLRSKTFHEIKLCQAGLDDYEYYAKLFPTIGMDCKPLSKASWSKSSMENALIIKDYKSMQPIGYMSPQYYDQVVYLDLLIVDKPYQRQGYGTRALEAFVKQISKKGYQSIYLDCDVKHTDIMEFYKRLGFVRESSMFHVNIPLTDFVNYKNVFSKKTAHQGYSIVIADQKEWPELESKFKIWKGYTRVRRVVVLKVSNPLDECEGIAMLGERSIFLFEMQNVDIVVPLIFYWITSNPDLVKTFVQPEIHFWIRFDEKVMQAVCANLPTAKLCETFDLLYLNLKSE